MKINGPASLDDLHVGKYCKQKVVCNQEKRKKEKKEKRKKGREENSGRVQTSNPHSRYFMFWSSRLVCREYFGLFVCTCFSSVSSCTPFPKAPAHCKVVNSLRLLSQFVQPLSQSQSSKDSFEKHHICM